jgi:hypothetical protein
MNLMRSACLAVCLLAGGWTTVAVASARSDPVTLYDPDPGHLWNRLHAALHTRPDRDGSIIGRDALDPIVFPTTTRWLEGPTHAEAVKLLDDFLAGAHRLVRDPLKRAILQRDLWGVFDWAAYPFGNFYTGPTSIRTGPLQDRLAKAIRNLALSKAEANALPDTYALAVKSKVYPVAFDPARPNAPFLPPDLFDPAGPWVCVTGPRELTTPIATEHARVFAGRSVFLVFIRLPEGRQATLAYLEKLNTFPRPWTVPPQEPDEITGRRPPAPELNPDVPQFPVGTQLALVRQLIVVADDGRPTTTPLTESVQVRTYREILPREREHGDHAEKSQGFVELELRRADLFAGKNGGLRAINGDDRVPSALTFFRSWADPFETEVEAPHNRPTPAFQLCAACHTQGGIRGVNSYSQTGSTRPPSSPGLFPVSVADARARSAAWKSGLADWAELKTLAGW